MSAYVTHPFGDSNDIFDLSELEKLYEEKDLGDGEHFGVDLANNGWVLGLYPSNILVWENLEDEKSKPKHLNNVTKEKVLELWKKLFLGKIEEIEKEPWEDEYF